MLPLAALPLAGALPVVGIVALLAVLIFLHEAGHFLAAKSLGIPVKQFAMGFGPALWSFQHKETQYRINALPLGGYCAFADDTLPESDPEGPPVDPRHYLRNRPLWQRSIVVSAGVAANLLLAWTAIVIQVAAVGIPHEKALDVAKSGVVVTSVIGQPARQAGLVEGDHVMAVDHRPLTSTEAFQKVVRANAGGTIDLTVRRDHPSPARTLDLVAHPGSDGRIGVAIAEPVDLSFTPTHNPLLIVSDASSRTVEIGATMLKGLWMLATRQLPLAMVGGPIAIVHLGATSVHTFYQLCLFAAMISLDLAIVNFLPVPGLDGGHMLFIAFEAIARRPLPRRVEESILQTGLVLLLGLGMLLIVKDIITLTPHHL